jgi:hypothetical protein
MAVPRDFIESPLPEEVETAYRERVRLWNIRVKLWWVAADFVFRPHLFMSFFAAWEHGGVCSGAVEELNHF